MKTKLGQLAAGAVVFLLFSNGMCSSASSTPDPTPADNGTTTTANDACQPLSIASSDGSRSTVGQDSKNRTSSVVITTSDGDTKFGLEYADKLDGTLNIIRGFTPEQYTSLTLCDFTGKQLTTLSQTISRLDAADTPFGTVSLTNVKNTVKLDWKDGRLVKATAVVSADGTPTVNNQTTTYEYDASGNVSKMSLFNNESLGGLVDVGLALYITFEYERDILEPKQRTGTNVELSFLTDGQIYVQPFSAKAVKKSTTYVVDGTETTSVTTTYTNTANSQGFLIKSVGKTVYTNLPPDTETITYTYSNCK